MNAERLRAVARAIARPKEGDPTFNMNWWALKMGHSMPTPAKIDCGTSCCIAGWTCHLFAKRTDQPIAYSVTARELLGLDSSQAYRLFYGSFVPGKESAIETITADEAVAELRRLADQADAENGVQQ